MNKYKVLKNQEFEFGEYKLIPIRFEDRFQIMKWRNEQIYHLRQIELLTEEKQNSYFENVISKLFDLEKPDQILFSFLKNEKIVGYGGLVHINWIDRNAEISFIIDTSLEKDFFNEFWSIYLKLIEKVAFYEFNLHKIFTYAFDLRPHLYITLESNDFKLDAILKDHCFFNNQYKDVRIHRKIGFSFERCSENHIAITHAWACNPIVRKYSFNSHKITIDEHTQWFLKSINNQNIDYYIFNFNQSPVGSFKVDKLNNEVGMISFLIDPKWHSQGLGKQIIKLGIYQIQQSDKNYHYLHAKVLPENLASVKIFEKLNFEKNELEDYFLFILKL